MKEVESKSKKLVNKKPGSTLGVSIIGSIDSTL